MNELRTSEIYLYIYAMKGWSPESTEQVYSPQKLKPAQMRRLSMLTRISVDLALQIAEGQKVDHIVFTSRHGELFNSAQLLQMISRHEILSPMQFSQSVHNTAIGNYSLAAANRASATSLCGGQNGFVAGLLSCQIYLNEYPSSQVLFIAGDVEMPEVFRPFVDEVAPDHILVMLLGAEPRSMAMHLSGERGRGSGEAVSSSQSYVAFQKLLSTDTVDFSLPEAPAKSDSDSLPLNWVFKKCSID